MNRKCFKSSRVVGLEGNQLRLEQKGDGFLNEVFKKINRKVFILRFLYCVCKVDLIINKDKCRRYNKVRECFLFQKISYRENEIEYFVWVS